MFNVGHKVDGKAQIKHWLDVACSRQPNDIKSPNKLCLINVLCLLGSVISPILSKQNENGSFSNNKLSI